ncbi:protein IQ-DOMAIN 1 isoform X1 [Sesamum indicum]|uniref:Protein IQ-DOMAIN 1 isoform X1 n=1 Tax=Sesamum indicum TaxID=4182 RepID=A0A6I9UPA7_SESIN|nr:protein IQ-DOMAIN 1 isoform X1 [Sesamum indicum]
MGSGVWFKNIISKKKVKEDRSEKLKRYSAPENINSYNEDLSLDKEYPVLANGASVDNQGRLGRSLEDAAATQIQTAYRAYLARKTFRHMRGMVRLQNMVQRDSVMKQASTTLSRLHSWSRIQAQIRARRVHMVLEGRLRQKKLENQLKLEAKLHDLEVEWSGGSETIDEALARIHQREAAAVKRERAMAYAFSHQWRANSNPSFGSGNEELSKANWGWSWKDRWIAARPWESRVAASESPKKAQSRQANKTTKTMFSPTSKAPDKVKLISPTGKPVRKARKLSYEGAQKISAKKVSPKPEEKKTRNGKEGS